MKNLILIMLCVATGISAFAQQFSVQCQSVDGDCINGNLGYAWVDVLGGTPPYSYAWSNGILTDSISDLMTGTYSVTVTDGQGITDDCSITIQIEGCCDVTAGALLASDQWSCIPFDPEPITTIVPPQGGMGELEIIWLYGTCGAPISTWVVIPNSNSLEYDPGLIFETTCFVQVSRRSGCVVYNGFSNMITISVDYVATISPIGATAICNGEPVVLQSLPSSYYMWSTGATTQSITVTETGSFWVIGGCGDTSAVFTVGEAFLNAPIIEATGACEFAVTNFNDSLSYQWLLDDDQLEGYTGQSVTDSLHGFHSVVVMDANGCEVVSNELFCENTTGIEETYTPESQLKVSPNPFVNEFNLSFHSSTTGKMVLELINSVGQNIWRKPNLNVQSGINNYQINNKLLPRGIYFLIVNKEGRKFGHKIIKK